MTNIGLLIGSPTQGGSDGVLVGPGNPIAGPDFFTGADTIGAAVAVAARVLVGGYQRAGTFTIQILGSTADRWRLAPNVGGAPGTWGAWGDPLTLPGPITPANTLFFAQSRALATDAAGDDTIVVFQIPDDVAANAPVGRSWVLPYAIGSVNTVGRSWSLPYSIRAAVGKSWALPSTVLATVGKSWALPYAIAASGLTDDFASSIDSSTWLAITSGTASISVSGGKAVITKDSTANKALLVAKVKPVAHGSTALISAKVDISNAGASDYQHPVLALARKSSAPTSGDTFTDVYFPLRIELYKYSVDGHLYYRFKYLDTGGTAQWYDFNPGNWSTTFDSATDGTGSWKILPSGDTTQYTFQIEFHATNGVRMLVKSADGATTHATSAWIPWSSINGSGDYYVSFGAWQYSFTTAFSGVMNVDSIAVT